MTQQINLYNPLLLPKPDVLSGRMLLIAIGAALGVGVLLTAWASWNASSLAAEERQAEAALNQVRSEIAALSQQAAARQPNSQLVAELHSLEALLAGHSQVIQVLKSGALGDTSGVSEYFKAFARETVDGLWLTGFTVVGAGNDITIEGRTLHAELVPTYLRKLSREDVLRGHEFATLSVDKPEQQASPPGGAVAKPPEFLEFRMTSRGGDAGTPRVQEAAQ